jgi:hypothetical protein
MYDVVAEMNEAISQVVVLAEQLEEIIKKSFPNIFREGFFY